MIPAPMLPTTMRPLPARSPATMDPAARASAAPTITSGYTGTNAPTMPATTPSTTTSAQRRRRPVPVGWGDKRGRAMEAGQRVQRPRHRGIDEKAGERARADGVGGQRHRDIDGQGGRRTPARREGTRETPQPEGAHEERAYDQQRAGKAVGAEGEETEHRGQAHPGRYRTGPTETLGPPPTRVLPRQDDRPGRPGQQLASVGDPAQDELTAAHHQHEQHQQPYHHVDARVLPAELLAQIAAELGETVSSAFPIGGALAAEDPEAGGAPHSLEAGHLGVGDLPRGLEAATPGEQGR